MSLSTKVLIGLGLGIVSGILFGEYNAFLKVFGDAFVLLLQMTVLPYIMVSLIAGLGGLSAGAAVSMARKCGAVLLLLWAVGMVMVLVMPLAFPKWESASFFSTSMVETRPPFDFLKLYIPANLFFSLANNVVPAVVVFSVAFGVALIGFKDKTVLLGVMSAAADVLGRITTFLVASLAPFGVFAIIASATGTMRLADLQRLQVYMLSYVVAALLLTFWILPQLVACLTPFGYKEVVGPVRTALVTAFATGNIFVVLPVLAEKSKALAAKLQAAPTESESTVDVVVSTSFSFPNLGKILTLSFVLYAGWSSDSAVPLGKYPTFAFSGFFSFFGDPTVAIPFLLDLLRIPSDTYRFFLVADNLVGVRFGTLLAAMYTLVLAVLCACAVTGSLEIRWRRLRRFAVLSVLLTAAGIGGTRVLFEQVVGHAYRGSELFTQMDLSHPQPAAAVHKTLPTAFPHEAGKSRLPQIQARGFLRVGYFPDALPFAFENQSGRLVGFDVEMAYQLAQDMKVRPEFVLIERREAAAMLERGYVDIVMSGMALTLDRVQQMTTSQPYTSETIAFVVKDYRREEFSSRENLKKIKYLKLGIPNISQISARVKDYLPQAEIVLLDSPRDFFSGKAGDLDAMLYSAEAGSAWTLIYPAFAVAIPQPDIRAVPVCYGLPRGDLDFADLVNTWIELKKRDQTITSLYSYWILGQENKGIEPRWSIIRNVLHLVE